MRHRRRDRERRRDDRRRRGDGRARRRASARASHVDESGRATRRVDAAVHAAAAANRRFVRSRRRAWRPTSSRDNDSPADAPTLEVLDGPSAGRSCTSGVTSSCSAAPGVQIAAVRQNAGRFPAACRSKASRRRASTAPRLPADGSLLAVGDEIEVAGTRLLYRPAAVSRQPYASPVVLAFSWQVTPSVTSGARAASGGGDAAMSTA